MYFFVCSGFGIWNECIRKGQRIDGRGKQEWGKKLKGEEGWRGDGEYK